jgi:hypothetical protein
LQRDEQNEIKLPMPECGSSAGYESADQGSSGFGGCHEPRPATALFITSKDKYNIPWFAQIIHHHELGICISIRTIYMYDQNMSTDEIRLNKSEQPDLNNV